MGFDYDLLVLGAGPGGLAAAERAASYGVRVAIVEQDRVGGTCVIHGCIPEKLMAYAASFSKLFQNADEYGWGKISRTFNWSEFTAARDRDIHHLSEVHTRKLREAGIVQYQGHAQFIDPHTVEIAGTQVTADKILIAVGARATKGEIPGIEFAITTRELLKLRHQPKHLAIVGSNHIAVKQAGILNGLICKVTLIVPESQILPGCDDDIRKAIQTEMSKLGIRICCNSQVERIEQTGNCLNLFMVGQSEPIIVETIIFIGERVPHLDGLGVENAGIEVQQGAIVVDRNSRTTQSNIFAVGDCTGCPPWTPVAIATARAFADTEFGHIPHQVNLDRIPYVISTMPEAATVGLTEAQARNQWGELVRTYSKSFQPLFNLMGESDQATLLKLVVNDASEQVIGAHMVGENATDIIQMIGLAMQAGVTKKDFSRAIGIHPSVGEEFFTLPGL